MKTCGCTPETRVSEKGLSEKTPSREKRKSEDARIDLVSLYLLFFTSSNLIALVWGRKALIYEFVQSTLFGWWW